MEDIDTWVRIVEAALVLAGLIVALTPTDKDDNVVGRVANVWRKLRGAK